MRVVGGSAKGTKLAAVPGDTTRPISDRVKTALFDILRPEIADMHILDLFAGTGSVGIEALSQGAERATFLDIEQKAFEVIKENLKKTHLRKQAEVRCIDCFRYMRNTEKSFDLIYVAPPQYKNLWVEALRCIAERPYLVNDSGLVIAQIDPKEFEPLELGCLSEEQQRRYGDSLLIFYRKV